MGKGVDGVEFGPDGEAAIGYPEIDETGETGGEVLAEEITPETVFVQGLFHQPFDGTVFEQIAERELEDGVALDIDDLPQLRQLDDQISGRDDIARAHTRRDGLAQGADVND